MKKIYIFAIGLLLIHFCSAQNKNFKTKVTKDRDIATTVTLNKSTKQKQGKYSKIDMNTGDTLVAGQYVNDKRAGLWRFAAKTDLYFSYDFTENRMTYTSPLIHAVDTFLVKADNGEYILSGVDTPPLFLGYKNEFEALLAKSIRIPLSVMQYHVAGKAIISFVIDDRGQIKEVKTETSLDKELDNEVVRKVTEVAGEWLPAIKNGKPVAVKLRVVVSLSEGLDTSPARSFAPKPYLIPLTLCYSSVTRTETRTIQSTSPQYNSRFR